MEKRFEYVIKVDGEDVWHGLNPEKKFDEIVAKNPKKKGLCCMANA
ncbi:MAG: hypothetical protein WBD09_10755 [Halobacteriota archaeon]